MVAVEVGAGQPCLGLRSMPRRALNNLIDNAQFGGDRATLCLEDSSQAMVRHALVIGLGLPQAERERG